MSEQVAVVAPLNVFAAVNSPGHAARPAGAKAGFDVLLAALRESQLSPTSRSDSPSARYTVKKGDTLSGICAAALRERGGAPTQSEILAATRKLAAENTLKNADKIYEGQQLTLASLGGGGTTSYAKAAACLPQGGTSMPALDWGLAMFADAVKVPGSADTNEGRLQSIVKDSSRISSTFGPRKNPFSGKGEFHSGIDIAAAAGSSVYPVRPGEVAFSGWQPGYGKVVIVRHDDNTQTLYAHNQRNLVQAGQKVGWDTPISQVGSTGDSTGPHVHFELRKNGRPIRPDHVVTGDSLKIAKAL